MADETCVKINCPQCGQHLEAPLSMLHDVVACPVCNAEIDIAKVVESQRMAQSIPPSSKPQAQTKALKGLWFKIISFLRGLFLKEPQGDIPDPVDAMANVPLFSISRLCPLAIVSLVMGWVISAFFPGFYEFDAEFGNSAIPVLLLAAGGVVASYCACRHFIRPGKLNMKVVVGVFVFSMVVGLVVLTLFQFVAGWALHNNVRYARGKVGLFFLILKCIGWSYEVVGDPSAGFLSRFAGYVCGVGLCEELTKMLPLIFILLTRKAFTFRQFVFLGFVSGLGFGAGENFDVYSPWGAGGVTGAAGNIVRWFACMPSHGIYAMIDAMVLWYLAPDIREEDKDGSSAAGMCALSVALAAVLHGIYDTVNSGSLWIGLALDGLTLLVLVPLGRFVVRKSMARGREVGDADYWGYQLQSYRTFGPHFFRLYLSILVVFLLAFCFSEENQPTYSPRPTVLGSSEHDDPGGYQSTYSPSISGFSVFDDLIERSVKRSGVKYQVLTVVERGRAICVFLDYDPYSGWYITDSAFCLKYSPYVNPHVVEGAVFGNDLYLVGTYPYLYNYNMIDLPLYFVDRDDAIREIIRQNKKTVGYPGVY